jgi:hypothetical protein
MPQRFLYNFKNRLDLPDKLVLGGIYLTICSLGTMVIWLDAFLISMTFLYLMTFLRYVVKFGDELFCPTLFFSVVFFRSSFL